MIGIHQWAEGKRGSAILVKDISDSVTFEQTEFYNTYHLLEADGDFELDVSMLSNSAQTLSALRGTATNSDERMQRYNFMDLDKNAIDGNEKENKMTAASVASNHIIWLKRKEVTL